MWEYKIIVASAGTTDTQLTATLNAAGLGRWELVHVSRESLLVGTLTQYKTWCVLKRLMDGKSPPTA